MHTASGLEPLIVHLTTVHRRHDTRIRIKEAATLSGFFGAVTLLVADGIGSEEHNGIRIVDLARPGGSRLRRAVFGSLRAFRRVRMLRPAVLHFHDPELVPLGLLLRLLGTNVIYDVHEDLPRQILSKLYLHPIMRLPLSWAAEVIEWVAGLSFSAIVCATPFIARRFPAHKTVLVQNFPLLSELVEPDATPYPDRPPHFAYVGGISEIRSASEMVDAMHLVNSDLRARLSVAGAFQPEGLLHRVRARPGWERVDFLGWAGRRDVAKLLGRVRGGLVVFQPHPNHTNAQPNKLFEYMAASLPLIASDFPLWRSIVADTGCGILVDPADPSAIAAAMTWILTHPEEAEEMGRRGRAAVEHQYNWSAEGERLVSLYTRLGLPPISTAGNDSK